MTGEHSSNGTCIKRKKYPSITPQFFILMLIIIFCFSAVSDRCDFDLGFCDWGNDLSGVGKKPWRLSSHRENQVPASVAARQDHGKKLGTPACYRSLLSDYSFIYFCVLKVSISCVSISQRRLYVI